MIRVVTDSSCDLPDHIVEQLLISVVPLTIRFDQEELVDGIDLTIGDFWDRLTQSDITPTTAAPSMGRFIETYTNLADEGVEGIVAVSISSGVSATHQSAVMAAEEYDRIPVRVVDSGLVSAALGLTVMEAAERAAAGGTVDEVADAAADAAAATNLLAALDTLEYLKRGGRIGGAQAFFGGLLDVKPLITFTDGVVSPAGRVRTRRKALAAILDHVDGLGDAGRLAVIHSDPPDLDDLLSALEDRGRAPIMTSRLGPVIGTHAGPGLLGVAYRLG